MIKTLAQFKSNQFEPFLPEDSQVNDGVYGAELAWWLCQKLAELGINSSYPEFEDFTWMLFYSKHEHEYEIYCHNQDAAKNQWQIQIKGFKTGIFNNQKTSFKEAETLIKAIIQILQNSPMIDELMVQPL